MVHSYFDAQYTQPDKDSSSSSDCENSEERLDNILNSLLANLTLYKGKEETEMTIKKYKKDRNKYDRSADHDKSNDKVPRNMNHYSYGAASSDAGSINSLSRRPVPSLDNHIYPEVRLSQPSNPKRSRSLLPSDNVNNPNSFDWGNHKICDTFTGNSGNNSEDEYYMATGSHSSRQHCQVEENQMSVLLKEKKGWKIINVQADGACLFRAVAHQIFGNEEEHRIIRDQVINYMKQNREHFSQFISEDFDRYLLRKLDPHAHGNHIEIQAISELYNRPVEIYFNSLDPINVFHREYTDLLPIRLSYHGGIHYNSIVDPQNPTFGEGLGMPNYQPGLSETELLEKAKLESERNAIEKSIFEEKLKESEVLDLERSIAEEVVKQSRFEYLKSLQSLDTDMGTNISTNEVNKWSDVHLRGGTSSSSSLRCCTNSVPASPKVVPVTVTKGVSSHSSTLETSTVARSVTAVAAAAAASCSYNKDTVDEINATFSSIAGESGDICQSSSTSKLSPPTTNFLGSRDLQEHDDYLIRHIPENMLDMDEDAILAMVMENSRQEYINSHCKNKPTTF